MTGGGIGTDYSVYREEGRVLSGTGGLASGPIPKMQMLNEIGRRVIIRTQDFPFFLFHRRSGGRYDCFSGKTKT